MRNQKQTALTNFFDMLGTNFKYSKVIPWAQQEFCIKQIKALKISQKQCISYYSKLKDKYIFNLIDIWPNGWHKNQKKLFLQLLLCYCNSKNKNPNQMKNQEWDYLSQIVFDKNPLFLKFQAFQYFNLQKITSWNHQDDKLIQKFIQKYGQHNWSDISKIIFYQTNCKIYIPAKQIRERWNNHVRKDLNKGPWTIDQDIILLNKIIKQGKRWSWIAQNFLKNRTQHMIKNRYNFLINKYEKQYLDKSTQIIDLIRKIKGKERLSQKFHQMKYEQKVRNNPVEKIQNQIRIDQIPQVNAQLSQQNLQKRENIVQYKKIMENQNLFLIKQNEFLFIPFYYNRMGFNQNIVQNNINQSLIPIYEASFINNTLNQFQASEFKILPFILLNNFQVQNQYYMMI